VVLFLHRRLSQKLPVSVRSPDGRTSLVLDRTEAGNLAYSVERNGETVIAWSQLRLRLAEGDVSSVEVRDFTPRSINAVNKLVATKAAEAVDRFEELTVEVVPRSGVLKSVALDIPRLRRWRGVPLSRAAWCRRHDTAGAQRRHRLRVWR
jgi:hypothetical protein